MPRRAARYVIAAALAAACHAAGAQDGSPAPATVVQQLAPQLLAFAGSQQNFQNLVTGLSQGTPVQLTSVLPSGLNQVVSFTPSGTLTPVQIAQVLESTRQQLIGLGIANPTGEQIGAALTGGTIPTPLSPTAQAQNSPVSVQVVPGAASGATAPPRINTSDSPVPAGATSRTPVLGNVSNTPTPPAATPTPPQAPRTPEAPRPARNPG
jgi:hypothetical protein